jgi:signal peptidase I
MSDSTDVKATPAGPRLRTRIWAVLVSLFVPGLGQAFLGRYRRALWFTAAVVIAALMIKASVFLWPVLRFAVLPVFLIGAVTGVVSVLWAAIDSWRLSRWAVLPRPAWPRRYLVYVGIILAWYAPNAIGIFAPSWEAFSAPSASMLPAIEVGDYFFVLDGYSATHAPQRGDLVVFKLPCDYPLLDQATAALYASRCNKATDFIKRVIGLPGDRIQIKKGILTINGQSAKRERLGLYAYNEDGHITRYTQYIETLADGYRGNILEVSDNQPLDNTDEITVPPNTFFMMGDNRDDSADSRDATSGVGFVPRDHLIGKAAFIYFSIDSGSSAKRGAFSLPAIRWDRIGMPLS